MGTIGSGTGALDTSALSTGALDTSALSTGALDTSALSTTAAGASQTAPGEVVSQAVRWRPAPPLRPFVDCYVGYRDAGLPPGRHRGLPSPYLTMIITLEDPLVIDVHPDPQAAPGSYDALVGGLHTRPALIVHDGSQSGVQLAVTPLGARALFGLPAAELVTIDVQAEQVLGGPVTRRLRERLREAPGWRSRFAALDAELLRLADPGRDERAAATRRGERFGMQAEVAWAWHRLLESGGTVPVAGLAAEVGWSSRHLTSRFGTEIGLAPKQAGRVVRFDRARRMLQATRTARPAFALPEESAFPDLAGASPTLADIAATCGFYDQAHLAREFGALAGCSPSRWLAEEFG